MAEPVTTNKGYTIPNTGDLVNTWGPVLNGNFSLLDSLQGSTYSLVVSSGAYTLTSSNAANLRVMVTGILSGNVTITVPQAAAYWYFHDQTTRGGYVITVTTGAAGGRTQNLPSRLGHLFTDGQNCYLVNEPLLGETKALSGSVTPPLWKLGYGQAISRTTYADLFAFMGTTYGAGDGSTTFNLPDYRGRALWGQDDMGGVAAGRITSASGFGTGIYVVGGNQLLQAHNHGINDPGHNHSISDPGHNHSQTSHTHGINDPGHQHSVPQSSTHTHNLGSTVDVAGGSSFSVFSAGVGGPDATGGAYAAIGNSNSATTGVSVAGAYAGINAATTGVSNSAAYTGISVQSNGSGASQNMPPAATVPIIIYCGQ